jgi:hypothetical protein
LLLIISSYNLLSAHIICCWLSAPSRWRLRRNIQERINSKQHNIQNCAFVGADEVSNSDFQGFGNEPTNRISNIMRAFQFPWVMWWKSFPTDSRSEFPLQKQLYPMRPRVPNTSKLWAKCKTVKSHKVNKLPIHTSNKTSCRYCWPCSLRRGFATARLLGLWVRIPLGEWMCVSCQCCLLSGRGLCHGLITHPEESYRLWRVVVRDIETYGPQRHRGEQIKRFILSRPGSHIPSPRADVNYKQNYTSGLP